VPHSPQKRAEASSLYPHDGQVMRGGVSRGGAAPVSSAAPQLPQNRAPVSSPWPQLPQMRVVVAMAVLD
jgi:hypothetical protein